MGRKGVQLGFHVALRLAMGPRWAFHVAMRVFFWLAHGDVIKTTKI